MLEHTNSKTSTGRWGTRQYSYSSIRWKLRSIKSLSWPGPRSRPVASNISLYLCISLLFPIKWSCSKQLSFSLSLFKSTSSGIYWTPFFLSSTLRLTLRPQLHLLLASDLSPKQWILILAPEPVSSVGIHLRTPTTGSYPSTQSIESTEASIVANYLPTARNWRAQPRAIFHIPCTSTRAYEAANSKQSILSSPSLDSSDPAGWRSPSPAAREAPVQQLSSSIEPSKFIPLLDPSKGSDAIRSIRPFTKATKPCVSSSPGSNELASTW